MEQPRLLTLLRPQLPHQMLLHGDWNVLYAVRFLKTETVFLLMENLIFKSNFHPLNQNHRRFTFFLYAVYF
jgi:hypothetical protein